MTHFLATDPRKTAPPAAGKATLTWRPCEEDLSIWRMLYVRPDRELFATIDLVRAELLTFEVEWDDREGLRRFVTWSVRRGFTAGMTVDEPGNGKVVADPEILGKALVIVEDAGIVSPVATWIMDRLSAALARR